MDISKENCGGGCLICNCTEYTSIFEYNQPDQYEQTVGVKEEGYARRWVQCKNCGFYYSLYSRDREILNKIYQASYRSQESSWRKNSPEELFHIITALPLEESETKSRVEWIKKNILSLWKGGIITEKTPPFNFLDIGGGNGVFAYEFGEEKPGKEKKWIPHVIDPDENAQFLKSKLNMEFIQSEYKSGLFGKKFDLISLIYVLEHLTNPQFFIENLIQDINSDSLIYIEVPDALCFRFRPKTDDIFNSCHLWMFDSYTLITFLNGWGLEVFCLNRVRPKRGHYALMALAGKKEREIKVLNSQDEKPWEK